MYLNKAKVTKFNDIEDFLNREWLFEDEFNKHVEEANIQDWAPQDKLRHYIFNVYRLKHFKEKDDRCFVEEEGEHGIRIEAYQVGHDDKADALQTIYDLTEEFNISVDDIVEVLVEKKL